ncbi:MAG: ABC transporter ATP-binding protein [Oscillospiraceae bacterium]|nr:ABC transporter ATP-binding protein [Oscillospiraceae bacterium]
MKKPDIRPFTRQFYRGNVGYFALMMVQTVLGTAAQLMISWLLQQIIDLITGANTDFTLRELALLAAGCLSLILIAYVTAYLSKPKLIAKAVGQYKSYTFEQLSRKGISAFSSENSSLYISALSNDTNTIENGYLNNLFLLIDNVAIFIGALALMFWYSPVLTLISVGLTALPLAASVFTGNLVAKAEKDVSDRNEDYMSTLRDSLMGFSVIKSFRAEAQICRIYIEKVRAVSGAKCLRRKMELIVEMLSTSAGLVVQFGVFLVGAYLALTGSAISAGSVLVFVQLLNYVVNPIGTIPQCLAELKAARALIEKLAAALNENIRETESVKPCTLDHALTVRDVSFAYESEKPVLSNVDLRFDAGKSYAIVGASGSGKSTLLNLLMASRSDYSGSILYDDTELRNISAESLYDMVSVVQQNVFIFNDTIRNNITMFSEFPDEEVENAIALSGLSELLSQRGEDYLCGENGCNLSGGEKQRVSIARSLLKNARVLLVDEATAALDAETAHRVTESILGLRELTRVIITHDLDRPTLEQFDEIIVLKNGRVAEQGTFFALMDRREYFYSLFTVSQ